MELRKSLNFAAVLWSFSVGKIHNGKSENPWRFFHRKIHYKWRLFVGKII